MIINLTQHSSTLEQEREGVKEPAPIIKEQIKKLLTFEELPRRDEIALRATLLAEVADKLLVGAADKAALIGGAPYLMGELENALKKKGIRPLYSFSRRFVVEELLPDGTVKKSSVFKHGGFIEID